MYNRYIPQPDGSFLKTRLNEPEGTFSGDFPQSPPAIPLAEDSQSCLKSSGPMGISRFFRNLFPQGLDTEDLIVILLLLLLSQDGGKNGNRALLTLGAYLFL